MESVWWISLLTGRIVDRHRHRRGGAQRNLELDRRVDPLARFRIRHRGLEAPVHLVLRIVAVTDWCRIRRRGASARCSSAIASAIASATRLPAPAVVKDVLEEVRGVRPLRLRMGGSIPIGGRSADRQAHEARKFVHSPATARSRDKQALRVRKTALNAAVFAGRLRSGARPTNMSSVLPAVPVEVRRDAGCDLGRRLLDRIPCQVRVARGGLDLRVT